MNVQKRARIVLVVSLVLCLISMIGSSWVQTSGGKVTVKDLRIETPSGHQLSALLFVPENATKDTPAPAIVVSHGWYNTREMQDLNYVELSRRGYVVMSIDMYGHGNSDAVVPEDWQTRGTGMYDAVELIANLPYVDKSQIGITGHSNGARAANWAIDDDNLAETPLVSAVLLVANDATYKNPDTEEFYNKYGSRDVGIVAAQYDEFFFRTQLEDGTFTAPRDYIDTANAQSFLNFGLDPSTEGEERSSYKLYKENIDGEEASRVIYNPAQIHPWNHLSKNVVTSSLEFFEDAIGAPNPIAPTQQVWQFKVFFNLIGLIGFVIFIVSLTKVLLYTSPFASLRASKDVLPSPAPIGVGKVWFYGGLIVSALVSGYSYLALFMWSATNKPAFFPQFPPFYIGVWCVVAGLFAILLMVVSYYFHNKKLGMNLRENGIIISFGTLVKTVALALTITALAFSLVFIADYFFKTDFRFWVLTVKAFSPDKLLIALKYLPFFLIFYVANSVAINCFNYVSVGKKEWMNTALLALFNSLAILIIVVIQYTNFFITGDVFFTSVSSIVGIWLFPIIVILIVAAIISRKIYRATNNPYLAGFINAFIITIMTVTNTLTQL